MYKFFTSSFSKIYLPRRIKQCCITGNYKQNVNSICSHLCNSTKRTILNTHTDLGADADILYSNDQFHIPSTPPMLKFPTNAKRKGLKYQTLVGL
jgi:hypothetical protein